MPDLGWMAVVAAVGLGIIGWRCGRNRRCDWDATVADWIGPALLISALVAAGVQLVDWATQP